MTHLLPQLALLVALAALVAKGDAKPVDPVVNDRTVIMRPTAGRGGGIPDLNALIGPIIMASGGIATNELDAGMKLFRPLIAALGSGASDDDQTNYIAAGMKLLRPLIAALGSGASDDDQTNDIAATMKRIRSLITTLGGGALYGDPTSGLAAGMTQDKENSDIDLTANIPLEQIVTDPRGVMESMVDNFQTAVEERGGGGALKIWNAFIKAMYYFLIFGVKFFAD